MSAIIRQNARGNWDVWLGGRIVVRDESYGVACQVETALNGQGDPCSECGEVADAILRRLA